MSMSWTELFERAERYGVTVEEIRDELEARRDEESR